MEPIIYMRWRVQYHYTPKTLYNFSFLARDVNRLGLKIFHSVIILQFYSNLITKFPSISEVMIIMLDLSFTFSPEISIA